MISLFEELIKNGKATQNKHDFKQNKIFDEAMAFDVMKYLAKKFDRRRMIGNNIMVVYMNILSYKMKSSKNQ